MHHCAAPPLAHSLMPRLLTRSASGYLPLLGATHLAILAAVPFAAAALALVQRKLLAGSPALRLALGAVLLSETLAWYSYQAALRQLTFPDHLPLELCDVTLFLVIFVLFTRSRAVFDLVYYTALAGTSMALITPNLWEPFPSLSTVQFFVAHGLVVVSVLYLAWSGMARPRPGSVWRAMLALNVWAAIVGAFDWRFQTDYMYLRARPQSVSLLSLLGGWPWYIVAAEPVALSLFLLLYLPFHRWRRPSP